MTEKYVTVRTIHVQTEILETIEEARKSANVGDTHKARALLDVAEAYERLLNRTSGVATAKELKETAVDNDDED